MFIVAAAVAASLNVATLVHRAAAPIAGEQHCHIRVVSHKFVGTPGTAFTYDGETFVIPPAGSIELIASKRAVSYELYGRSLPLNVFPLDDFGTETVRVPEVFTSATPSDATQPLSPATTAATPAAAPAVAK